MAKVYKKSYIIKKLILLLIQITLLFSIYTKAFASWYAYYTEGNFSGIWATISTPSSAPYAPPGVSPNQSNSVTTPGPFWMQTGWLYNPNFSDLAFEYYEYCAEGCTTDPQQYVLRRLNTQPWSSSNKYEVSYDGSQGAKTWCAWVNGIRVFCKENIQPPIISVIAQSEIHFSSSVELDTEFTSIKVRNSSNLWVSPNLNNTLHADFPYKAEKVTQDHFKTFRQQYKSVFLPFVIK